LIAELGKFRSTSKRNNSPANVIIPVENNEKYCE